MKRVFAAIALIILIIALCITETVYSDKYFGKVESRINVCRVLYETDRAECIKKCEELQKDWLDKASAATVFINHFYIDEISSEMAALPVLARYGGADFLSACARCETVLEQIRRDQHVTIDSFY